MRALQDQVASVWQATVATDTRLTTVGRLEAEAETVAISVAFASIAVRVLDRHVFNDEYLRTGKTSRSSSYERFRDGDAQGRVVTGLAMIRDSEIHLPVLIDPDVDRALGIPATTPTRFRVFPRWVPYRRLPREMRANRERRERRVQRLAYRSHVASRLVTETLLDALAFFLGCDPALARRDPSGELEHFPLPELIQHDPYERRHPEWPTVEEVAEEARAKVTAKPPSGLEREILHRLVDAAGNIEAYVGYTQVTAAYREVFTEMQEQIAADVVAGYRYRVAGVGVTVTTGGRLMVGSDELAAVPLAPFPAPGGTDRPEDVWRELHKLAREDGFYYASRRAVG